MAFLLLVSPCFAQEWQEARMIQGIVAGSGAAPATEGEESCAGNCIVTCAWTGSDIFNTGAGTGHVWTGAGLNLPNAIFAVDATGKGFNGWAHSGKVTGTLAATQYYVDLTAFDSAQSAVRVFILPTVLADGADFTFLRIMGGATELARVELCRVGTLTTFRFYFRNSLGAYIGGDVYTLTVGTGYQIELLFQNAASATLTYGKVWDANGTNLLASTTIGAYTMSLTNTTTVRMGYLAGAGGTANTYYLDAAAVYAGAAQSFIGPKTP